MMSKNFRNYIAAVGTAGLLVVGLAACSQSTSTPSDTGSGSSSSSSAPATTPSAAPTPVATIAKLSGVDTKVTLDKGFVDALGSLKLTPGVIGTAKLSDEGVLSFPITGGNVTYYDPASKVAGGYVQGEVDHNGSGISLKGGDTTVKLTDFVIHPGSGSYLSGTVQVNDGDKMTDVPIFTLDGSTLKPLSKDADGNAVLEGTRVLVSPEAADLLNQTFKTDAVKGGNDGLLVGVAKITAK
jgi:hypothetical protein